MYGNWELCLFGYIEKCFSSIKADKRNFKYSGRLANSATVNPSEFPGTGRIITPKSVIWGGDVLNGDSDRTILVT